MNIFKEDWWHDEIGYFINLLIMLVVLIWTFIADNDNMWAFLKFITPYFYIILGGLVGKRLTENLKNGKKNGR